MHVFSFAFSSISIDKSNLDAPQTPHGWARYNQLHIFFFQIIV